MENTQLMTFEQGGELSLSRPPETLLKEAEMVAGPWSRKVESLGLYRKIGDKKHLYIEAWQMMGALYRVTARIRETKYLEMGEVKGYEAIAEAYHIPSGQVISTAEAMCLSDEEKWGPRPKYEYHGDQRVMTGYVATPLQQLRSMAQTRACSKVLSNLFKWVAVMKGYQGTPAEEMMGQEAEHEHPPAPQRSTPVNESTDAVISEPQAKRMFAIAKQTGLSNEQYANFLKRHGYERAAEVKRSDYERLVAEIQGQTEQGAPAA